MKIIKFKERILGVFYNTLCSIFSLKANYIVFESQHGKDFFGNPYYMVDFIANNELYDEFKIICILNNKFVKKKFKFIERVKFSKRNSLSYIYYIAVSKFLINDVTFPPYFSRRTGQKYLNTWHGTPLKTLGRNTANSPFIGVANAQRNFLHTTHLLAPNSHTEEVLMSDYMIKDIWGGRLLRSGYPRNDVLFSSKNDVDVSISDRLKKIAFMPTWRGELSNIAGSSEGHLQKIVVFLEELDRLLPDNAKVYVRLHPIILGIISFDQYRKILGFPDNCEPYEFLSTCDILITDYSSVIFDFCLTKKPIILYVPDEQDYKTTRNFSIEFSSIPFPKARSTFEVISQVQDILKNGSSFDKEYQRFIELFCPFESGKSTKKLCSDFILNTKLAESFDCKEETGKKNILIFCGSFLNNGITTSLKNLMSKIDANKYNIYLWIDEEVGDRYGKEYFYSLRPDIKYVSSKDMFTFGVIDSFLFFIYYIFKQQFKYGDKFLKRLWSYDARRRFCDVEWDTIVHFTGYDRVPVFIMLASTAKKIVYMHNDMYREVISNRVFDSRVLKLSYELADVVATVSPRVHENYCKNIYDIKHKVLYVPNVVSLDCLDKSKENIVHSLDNSVSDEVKRRALSALEKPDVFRYVNVARFSPEKGQMRLIEAFERVWRDTPDCQLFIIGGHGFLYESLVEKSKMSPASDSIFILLGSSNPFPLLKKMNSFVFSSFYEGIGMVLFESFALGLPVISTNIPGPACLLNNGYGLVVENSVSGLVDGMRKALNDDFEYKNYDFEAHNEFALKQFYSAIN
ncbi:MAG: glycosyltransferase [Saccharofermentanales bacterium]